MIKRSTQVPNILFDRYLPILTPSELKILLIIYRQTYGWHNPRTRRRKTRDRITHRQFMVKTGLARRVVSSAIRSLENKGLIKITDAEGSILKSKRRSGRSYLFYSPICTENNPNLCIFLHQPVHMGAHNKTNLTKLRYSTAKKT